MGARKPPFDAQPVEPSEGERLDSWKEIATHLKRDESTVGGGKEKVCRCVATCTGRRLRSTPAAFFGLPRAAGPGQPLRKSFPNTQPIQFKNANLPRRKQLRVLISTNFRDR